MSQVLQCTQFWALMTKRGSVRRVVCGVNDFIDAGRAVQPGRLSVTGKVVADRNGRIRQPQMDRLILLMVGVRQEHRGALYRS